MAVAVTLMALLASCHTTEENYKQAYDKAVEKTRQNRGMDWDEKQAERSRANYEIDGDSIRLLRYRFSVVDDGAQVAHKYSVVTGEFKQKFNALNMRNRYKEEGHASYVVYNSKETTYFVVVEGFDDVAVAAAFIRIMDKKTKVKTAIPRPWVLERI